MKKFLITSLLASAFVAGSFSTLAVDKKKDEKKADYPLTTCVVSGEKLGEMGKPHTFIYEGREVKLCCKSCLKDFNKEPAKFVKKVEAAEKPSK